MTMQKVLYLFLLLTLAACTMPAAQPFAALDDNTRNATSTPSTNAAQLVNHNPPTTTTNATPPACIVTARAWLNLRSDAGTFAPAVGTLAHGAIVTMTGNQRGAWLEVETPAGVGWVNSFFCEVKQ